jgi:hypothetical protein
VYDRRVKRVFDWTIQTSGKEIVVLEGEGMGRVIVLDEMRVAAKISFVDDVVKVNTIEGYTALINFEDKTISINNETDQSK